MADQQNGVEWAGVGFTPMHHHDGRMFRVPGLFAFVRRSAGTDRVLLFAGHADNLAASAGPSHPMWVDALRLGMNELNLNIAAVERLDRLQLLDRVVRRCEPLLNVLAEHPPAMLARGQGRRQAPVLSPTGQVRAAAGELGTERALSDPTAPPALQRASRASG